LFLAACGGGNDDTTKTTITGLSISGVSQINESSSATYTATATYSDGSSKTVTSSSAWSENSSYTSVNSGGTVTTSSVTSDQTFTLIATYSELTATKSITIKNDGDTTPPVISSVTSGSITSSGATITWTTDENADSQVEYGITTTYGSKTTLDTTLVTSHSHAITGLAASTLYHYRVISKDSSGNTATSGDYTFTTTNGGGGTSKFGEAKWGTDRWE